MINTSIMAYLAEAIADFKLSIWLTILALALYCYLALIVSVRIISAITRKVLIITRHLRGLFNRLNLSLRTWRLSIAAE